MSLGCEGQHEASLPACDRHTVQPLLKTNTLQKATFLPLLFSLCSAGKKEIPAARLEYCLWL